MNVMIFSIYDIKSKAFGQPFFSITRGTAIRAFSEAVNDPQTPYNKYPDDFTLFQLGEFDDNNGDLTPLPDGKQTVVNALEVLLERKPASNYNGVNKIPHDENQPMEQ